MHAGTCVVRSADIKGCLGFYLVFGDQARALHYRLYRSRADDSDSKESTTRAQKRRPPEAHAHAHNIVYTLFDECIAPGPSGFVPRRSLTGWLRCHSPCQNPPPTTPFPLLFPQISLLDDGAGVAAPEVCPLEWREQYGCHGACVARRLGGGHLESSGLNGVYHFSLQLRLGRATGRAGRAG